MPNETTRREADCIQCGATGHSLHGIWDCELCEGTGIADKTVRNACVTIIAAGRQVPRNRVTEAEVNRFWVKVNELRDEREATNAA